VEQIAGVSRVVVKESEPGRVVLEVESLEGASIRAELARAVVHAGWNLEELRAAATSLEDVFLELTASEKNKASATPTPEVIQ
jgi:hypothetical protein